MSLEQILGVTYEIKVFDLLALDSTLSYSKAEIESLCEIYDVSYIIPKLIEDKIIEIRGFDGENDPLYALCDNDTTRGLNMAVLDNCAMYGEMVCKNDNNSL